MPDWIWWLVAVAAAVLAVLGAVLVRGRTPKWFSVPVFVGAAALAGWAGFRASCSYGCATQAPASFASSAAP